MTAHRFLWFDVETTGLDPKVGLVLEFAAVLCEDARGDDFAIVQQYTAAIHHDEAVLKLVPIDDFVRRMHDSNGLWRDVETSKVSQIETDEFLADLASDLTGGRKRSIVLAGNSVHFDRAWCLVHLPRFAEYLSHRILDVTSLQFAIDAWAPGLVDFPMASAHRALADVHETIERARIARRVMGWAP